MNNIGVYILQSELNNRYYVGSTNNIQRRLKQHMDGKAKATKNILPLSIKYFHPTETLKEARQLEIKIKKLKSKKIIEKIIKNQCISLK